MMETKLQKLGKVSGSLWTWASRSWWTRMVVGICLIILVIRLATTCISAFGVRIGCDETFNNLGEYEEELEREIESTLD